LNDTYLVRILKVSAAVQLDEKGDYVHEIIYQEF
jgi:hypothetical protein